MANLGNGAGVGGAGGGGVIIEDLDRFLADPAHRGALVGHIDFDPLGQDIPATGHVELFAAGPTAGSPSYRCFNSFCIAWACAGVVMNSPVTR